jgi:hypothetical protein
MAFRACSVAGTSCPGRLRLSRFQGRIGGFVDVRGRPARTVSAGWPSQGVLICPASLLHPLLHRWALYPATVAARSARWVIAPTSLSLATLGRTVSDCSREGRAFLPAAGAEAPEGLGMGAELRGFPTRAGGATSGTKLPGPPLDPDPRERGTGPTSSMPHLVGLRSKLLPRIRHLASCTSWPVTS